MNKHVRLGIFLLGIWSIGSVLGRQYMPFFHNFLPKNSGQNLNLLSVKPLLFDRTWGWCLCLPLHIVPSLERTRNWDHSSVFLATPDRTKKWAAFNSSATFDRTRGLTATLDRTRTHVRSNKKEEPRSIKPDALDSSTKLGSDGPRNGRTYTRSNKEKDPCSIEHGD